MTLKLQDNITNYTLSFNLANATGSWTLILTSQMSKLEVLNTPMTILATSDRFTKFSFNIPLELPLEHQNGILNYSISNGGSQGEVGLLKLVTGSGGTSGTQAYLSNNETQEAPIYFRPQY